MERDEFLAYCKAFPDSRILEWDFGPVMELKETPDPKNYLFSRERVPFHWDGAFHQVPTYLAFSCIEAPLEGAGGETLFANTESIWEKSTEAEKDLYSGVRLTFETKKLAHYGGKITGKLVQSHPESGKPILRFAEAVIDGAESRHAWRWAGSPKKNAREFVEGLTRKIYDPSFCLAHTWQNGDFLFADNHALFMGGGLSSEIVRGICDESKLFNGRTDLMAKIKTALLDIKTRHPPLNSRANFERRARSSGRKPISSGWSPIMNLPRPF